MTVLFVLFTFALFLGIDYAIRHRQAALQPAPVRAPRTEAVLPPLGEPIWVAGFQVSDELRYHPGHTWARPLTAEVAAVGIDDFARQLLGRSERVELPAPGTWVRQGSPMARITQNGRTVSLVAPVDGEVVEVNPQLAAQPGLTTDDPYGRGWLVKVRAGELGRSLSNLLGGSLVRRFMEDSRERLQHSLMALSGTVLADGGEPVADFARHLTDEEWERLAHEFFLS